MKIENKKFILTIIFIFFAILFFLGSIWAIKNFNFTFESLIFYLRVPSKGANFGPFLRFGEKCILPSILVCITLIILLKNPFKWEIKLKMKEKNISIFPVKYNENILLILSFILFAISFIVSFEKIGLFYYLNAQVSTSDFIEENYVDTNNVSITAKNKRNLIYIYIESLESTYFKKQDGGEMVDDIMPNLTTLSNKYINFSNNSLIGGAYEVPGTAWTVAGIVAQTTGIPLKLPIDGNGYGNFKSFLPGVNALGDVLRKNGYNQLFLMGSDATFGGRSSYLKSHGDYIIYDYNTAIKNEKIEKDYYVWWGFEDNKLFEYAKEEILNLAKEDKPFNFTMLTVDMHFPDGYLSNECEAKFDKNLSNVIACTDKKIGEFISWAQNQEFYENTTIIIAGDHLSMDGNYFRNISSDYQRNIYNLFINSCVTTSNYKNRSFTVFDMFPTTLASICFDIEGNKLGLGTNLFSNEATIIEKYGLDYVRNELNKRSVFYNENILYTKK